MLSITHQALEKFDNSHDFERLASDILNSLGFRDVTPIAPRGGSDGGRDVTYKTYDNQKALACISLRDDAKAKILSDLKKHKRGEYAEYTYFTNQYLTSSEKQGVEKYCYDELGASFVSRDVEAIRSLLDTALKDLRKKYLGIELPDTPEYEIRAIDLKKYNVVGRIKKAQKAIEKEKAEEKQEKANNPYGFNFNNILIGKNHETSIVELELYIEKLQQQNDKISRLISFNIELTSSLPDTHVEVLVSPPTDVKLMFDNGRILPEPPSTGGYGLYIPPITNTYHKDENEFFAKRASDKVSIKSNLETLNPMHPKIVFDEKVFIVSEVPLDTYDLTIKIYSTKLTPPLILPLVVNSSDAEFKEV